MPVYADQIGRKIELSTIPQRILSTVPSQTEGLHEEVKGITKFCIHPDEWFRSKTKIGGTKNLNIETIHQLQPDLILANKEENTKDQMEELATHYPVWISDVNTLQDAYNMIDQIGMITNKQEKATTLVDNIKKAFATLQPLPSPITTAYLIWKDPFMAAGSGTFIHNILQSAGFENVFAEYKRYPSVSIAAIAEKKCDALFLSTEPYPFTIKHIEDLQALLPQIKIVLVNGELFSWYGSRLLQTPAYLQKLQDQFAH
jgi:ABC-type Fe3+-hydroxamate transport system substrate-binding protein